MADGTIVIDTKIDDSGAKKGTQSAKAEVAKLAAEYKKAGMSSSQAWKKAWSEIGRSSVNGSNRAKGSIESVASVAKKCAAVIGGLFIIDKVKDYTVAVSKTGIAYNAMAEQSQVAWSTILGSSEKATKMMKDIEQYAAKTPFSKMGVDQMAKQLSNAGFEGQALFDQLTKFGNMGSAFGIQEDSLKEMVRQYAQVQQAQVAYTEDLNILQDRGIPIYKALGEVMGVPVSQVKKLASQGKVTADVYNKAIDSMSNKTKGAMEEQSKTFNGMVSTLKDNLTILAGKLAEPMFDRMKSNLQELMPKLENFTKLVGEQGIADAVSQTFPQLKPLVDLVTDLGRTLNETVIPALTSFGGWVLEHLGPIAFLASTIGGVVLAFKAMSIISGIVAFAQGLAAAFGLLEVATLGETAAQWAANLAFLACPLTWIVIAIGAVVGAFIYLWNTSEGFRNFWIGMWNGIKEIVGNAIDGIKGFFTETIPNTLNSIKEWGIGIKDSFVEWTSNTYDSVKDWVSSIGESFSNFYNTSKSKVSDFASSVKEKCNSIIENIKNFPEYAKTIFNNFIENAKTSLSNGIENIKTIFADIVLSIEGKIMDIINAIKNMPDILYEVGYNISNFFFTTLINIFNNVSNFFTNVIPNAFNNFILYIKTSFNNFVAWISTIPGRIYQGLLSLNEYLLQIKTNIQNWILDVWNKFSNWATDMWNKAKEVGRNIFNGLIDWISKIPDKVFNYLQNTWNKFSNWSTNMWNKAKEVGRNIVNSIVNYISQLPSKVWNWLVNTYNRVVNFGSNMINKAREIGREFTTWLMDSIRDLPNKIANIGRNIVEGLWNGIVGMKDWLWGNVKGFFSGLVDGAKAALGIHSPSRVFRDEVGKWIMPGVEVGIDKTMPSLQANMKEKMLSLAREMKAKVQFETNSIGATIVAKSNGEIASNNTSNSNNVDRPLIVKVENKNYLDGEEIAGHTTEKVIENIGDSQDSYTISTGGDFSFA